MNNSEKREVFGVVLSVGMKDAIGDLAHESGMNRSEWARRVLSDAVRDQVVFSFVRKSGNNPVANAAPRDESVVGGAA